MKDDYYANVPRILTSSGPKSARRTIKDGASGYCPKPEDYHSNTPHFEITWTPPEQAMPLVCVGAVGHQHVPLELFASPMPLWINRVPPMQGGGAHVKGNIMQTLVSLPKALVGGVSRRIFNSTYLWPTGSYRGISRMINLMTHDTVLEYGGDGGLLVAGQAVWCMPWGTYNVAAQTELVMPAKDYIRQVLLWAINGRRYPLPTQEKFVGTYLPQRRLTPPFPFNPVSWSNSPQSESYPGLHFENKDWGLRYQCPTKVNSENDFYYSMGSNQNWYFGNSLEKENNPLANRMGLLHAVKEKLTANSTLWFPQGGLATDVEPERPDYPCPRRYAEAVENGYVGTFKEWVWLELEK